MKILIKKKEINFYREFKLFSSKNNKSGSLVNFIGNVREKSNTKLVREMVIECYKKMAEKQIKIIADKAIAKWHINDYKIIHRYGKLNVGDTIVVVLVSSQHREEGLKATSYIINWLKIKSTFWKKEIYYDSEKWVDQNDKDLRILKNANLQRSP